MAVEILSVHFPKAGGTALRHALETAFGTEAVHGDYGDDPTNPCSAFHIDPQRCRRSAEVTASRPEIRVIHGHFHPAKYQFLTGVRRITFLRHPIDNLISLFFYWKIDRRSPGNLWRFLPVTEEGARRFAGQRHAIFDYFHQHQLSLLELAQLPLLRYLLSRTYFGGVDLAEFDFIGFAENYPLDTRALSQSLAIPLDESRSHRNRYPDYFHEREELKADHRLMSRLQDLLSDDIRLYEQLRARHEYSTPIA